MVKTYYSLTKPGIIYGNALVAAAGFILASGGLFGGAVDWWLLAAMLAGLSLIIASAAVANNYYDRDIDALMERTRDRALPAGRIKPLHALLFAFALGLLGAVILLIFTNLLTLAVALTGFVVYVFLYSPLKHRTGYALFVGAVAGATPPVIGYTAVTNTLDSTALALFIFLFVWQLPHFLAIAVYRFDEYAAAGVPLLLITKKPSEQVRWWGRMIFYASLAVLLAWCAALMVQR